MSARTLKSLQKEGVEQVYGMATARWHAMRGCDRFTDSPLKEHSASARIHVQCSIEGIARVAAL
eukprot:1669433-Amphidinium_carterae.1